MKRPSFQFYPGDWRANAKLGRCTHAERGIWITVMCLLHDSDEQYGVLHWPLEDLAQAAGCKVADLQALRRKKVLKGADTGERFDGHVYTPRHAGKDGEPVTLVPAQDGPVWFSSRMVEDEYKRANAGAATRFGTRPAEPTLPGETDRQKLQRMVLAKTDGHCHHCKVKLGKAWHIDHLVPRSKGGPNTFDNLVPSCVPCNQDKADTMPDDWSPPSRRDGGGATASASSPPAVDQGQKPLSGPAASDAVGKSDTAKATARAAATAAAIEAIDYLNAKAGTKFRHTPANLKFAIDRQLIDKATPADLKAVVDAKIADKDFDRKYLRPETLWNATKFGSYIGQVGAVDLAKMKHIVVAIELRDSSRKTVAEYEYSRDFDAFALVVRTARNPAHREQLVAPDVAAVLVYVDKEQGLKGRWSVMEVREGLKKAA